MAAAENSHSEGLRTRLILDLPADTRQTFLVPTSELAPDMTRLAEMFIDLVDAPDIALLVFLIFGVDGV
jgi:hypothetical protein